MVCGQINKDRNILTVKLPLGKRTSTEWCYLLGDFGVRTVGRTSVITKKSEKLAFGSIVEQGMPFYGGNITYHLEAETPNGEIIITVPQYRGGLAKVIIDGEEKGYIVYSPNTLRITGLEKCRHSVDIMLYTNRFNSFGSVHNSDSMLTWQGPDSWRTENEKWSYEYRLRPAGILSSPVIKV